MSSTEISTAKLSISPRNILSSIFCFSRSIFAEWIVYALVFHSMTAVVTFFLFIPADCLNGYFRGEFGRGFFVDFQTAFFAIPFNNTKLSVFLLPTRVILIGLWTLTARPSLALAGWIVRKRLPAYTFPTEDYPPIRWPFEFFCSFANRHHYVIPDGELYARQILRLMGARVAASSCKLGTFMPGEVEELREFSHVFHTATKQFLERRSVEPPLWFPPLNLGEHTRYLCAFEIIPRHPERQTQCDDHCISALAESSPSQHRKGFIPKRLDWKNVRSDVRRFLCMYHFTVWYWILRPSADAMAVCLPHAFDEATSGVQEWYDKNALPRPRGPK